MWICHELKQVMPLITTLNIERTPRLNGLVGQVKRPLRIAQKMMNRRLKNGFVLSSPWKNMGIREGICRRIKKVLLFESRHVCREKFKTFPYANTLSPEFSTATVSFAAVFFAPKKMAKD